MAVFIFATISLQNHLILADDKDDNGIDDELEQQLEKALEDGATIEGGEVEGPVAQMLASIQSELPANYKLNPLNISADDLEELEAIQKLVDEIPTTGSLLVARNELELMEEILSRVDALRKKILRKEKYPSDRLVFRRLTKIGPASILASIATRPSLADRLASLHKYTLIQSERAKLNDEHGKQEAAWAKLAESILAVEMKFTDLRHTENILATLLLRIKGELSKNSEKSPFEGRVLKAFGELDEAKLFTKKTIGGREFLKWNNNQALQALIDKVFDALSRLKPPDSEKAYILEVVARVQRWVALKKSNRGLFEEIYKSGQEGDPELRGKLIRDAKRFRFGLKDGLLIWSRIGTRDGLKFSAKFGLSMVHFYFARVLADQILKPYHLAVNDIYASPEEVGSAVGDFTRLLSDAGGHLNYVTFCMLMAATSAAADKVGLTAEKVINQKVSPSGKSVAPTSPSTIATASTGTTEAVAAESTIASTLKEGSTKAKLSIGAVEAAGWNARAEKVLEFMKRKGVAVTTKTGSYTYSFLRKHIPSFSRHLLREVSTLGVTMVANDIFWELVDGEKFKEIRWLKSQGYEEEASELFWDLFADEFLTTEFLVQNGVVTGAFAMSSYFWRIFNKDWHTLRSVPGALGIATKSIAWVGTAVTLALSFIAADLAEELLKPVLLKLELDHKLKKGINLFEESIVNMGSRDFFVSFEKMAEEINAVDFIQPQSTQEKRDAYNDFMYEFIESLLYGKKDDESATAVILKYSSLPDKNKLACEINELIEISELQAEGELKQDAKIIFAMAKKRDRTDISKRFANTKKVLAAIIRFKDLLDDVNRYKFTERKYYYTRQYSFESIAAFISEIKNFNATLTAQESRLETHLADPERFTQALYTYLNYHRKIEDLENEYTKHIPPQGTKDNVEYKSKRLETRNKQRKAFEEYAELRDSLDHELYSFFEDEQLESLLSTYSKVGSKVDTATEAGIFSKDKNGNYKYDIIQVLLGIQNGKFASDESEAQIVANASKIGKEEVKNIGSAFAERKKAYVRFEEERLVNKIKAHQSIKLREEIQETKLEYFRILPRTWPWLIKYGYIGPRNYAAGWAEDKGTGDLASVKQELALLKNLISVDNGMGQGEREKIYNDTVKRLRGKSSEDSMRGVYFKELLFIVEWAFGNKLHETLLDSQKENYGWLNITNHESREAIFSLINKLMKDLLVKQIIGARYDVTIASWEQEHGPVWSAYETGVPLKDLLDTKDSKLQKLQNGFNAHATVDRVAFISNVDQAGVLKESIPDDSISLLVNFLLELQQNNSLNFVDTVEKLSIPPWIFKLYTNSLVANARKTPTNISAWSDRMRQSFNESLVDQWENDQSILGTWPLWVIIQFSQLLESNSDLQQKVDAILTALWVIDKERISKWNYDGVSFVISRLARNKENVGESITSIVEWFATYISTTPPVDFYINESWGAGFQDELATYLLEKIFTASMSVIAWPDSMIEFLSPYVAADEETYDPIIWKALLQQRADFIESKKAAGEKK